MHKTARANRREKKGVGERARPVKREGENKIYIGETVWNPKAKQAMCRWTFRND